MTKNELRKKYKAKRKELSEQEIDQFSLEIANQCLNLDIWNKRLYHIFLSITRHQEINTEYLLHAIQGKDKDVVISKTKKDLEMSHYLLTDSTPIKINNYGIPEPQDGISIKAEDVDVVFVPLLAFDQHGNRVGYGKGYYDVFLEQCRKDVIKVGLSFFSAEEEIEAQAHDQQLNYCVTPSKIYEFKN
ncbi:MAG: 5-formyltetrahydrofolate cyclo-ligase [Psychroflexus halocasei]|uniref:5-formyltetrahydrofolate cyclo-ligase n=1 Tax=Psychroflexus sp. S27 TaxID=1982757 RepID=UPI000C2A3B45|nr:5-formyltetrahydrofolate cyclo-ligase [Psychroflexus sp. S27]PJX27562.1 5-formyltetrahydrofolate cyclo-ligase [Psychroflexus sp. S27]